MSLSNELVPATEAPLSQAVAELIPFAHHADWLAMPLAERERIKELLELMAAIKADERGVMTALKSIAQANSGRRGWSFHNLRTLFYGWLSMNGDWRALARHYIHDTSLPQDFINYLRTGALKEHRSRKQAINKVREAWRAGEKIPGYGTWREWFATRWPDRDVPRHFTGDYPDGWSNSNLYLYMPSRVQHKLATKGRAAINDMLPKLQRDPSELRFLECVTVDDFETDVRVCHGRQVVTVRGLLMIDVATRTRLAVGFKPRLVSDEGTKIGVTTQDMMFLFKTAVGRFGVPRDYPMTVLIENSAATFTGDQQAALDLHFGGQVRIERTGIMNYKTAANGFVERGGKPQEKGWIESYFNLAWNRAGSLPGQKGSRYDNKPGDLEAKMKYVKQLAAYETTDEQWAALRKPFLSFDELVIAFEAVFDWMDQRTEHKMLGFEKITEWRLGPGDAPKPIDEMALVPVADQTKVEILPPRMESPAERRARLIAASAFVRVPEPVLALLAFSAKPVTVKNHHVTFTLRGKGYTFAQGGAEALHGRNGQEIIAYYDEQSMAGIYCFARDGAYLGAVKQLGGKLALKDADAISAAAEQLRDFYQREVKGPVDALLAADRTQAEADRGHNETRLVQWRLKAPAGDDEKKRPALSKTLADDKFTASPDERFAVAHVVAAGIASSATEEADERRRRTSSRKPTREFADIVEPAAGAGNDVDLGKLL